MVQWLRICPCNARDVGLIPGPDPAHLRATKPAGLNYFSPRAQESLSHNQTPQQKLLSTATKTQLSQINKLKKKKKRKKTNAKENRTTQLKQ